MAPSRWRGALTAGYQFFLALGVLTANLVNYATARASWGWRVSLGLAGAPAVVIFVGALFLTDTPTSLVMRGRADRARAALLRVRGPDADVDAELRDIAKAVEAARRSEDGAFRRMATRREYRPHLVLAVAVPMFFQLTGVIVLAFFAPLVFRTVGFGSNAALMGAVINVIPPALHPRHRQVRPQGALYGRRHPNGHSQVFPNTLRHEDDAANVLYIFFFFSSEFLS